MKKSLVAIAALAATGAFAQSSVTLGGLIDLGIVNQNNVAPGLSKLSVGTGNNNRLIFSGVEDLGGGLAATFGIQPRFNGATGTQEGGSVGLVNSTSNNGAAGDATGAKDLNGNFLISGANGVQTVNYGRPLFQGETRVGLRGSFGHVRIGRGLTALQAPNGGYIDPWGVSTVASSVYAAGFASDYAAGGEGRIDSAIFYDTPNFAGFTGSLSFSPKKVAIGGASAKTADVFNGAAFVSSGNAADFSKRHVAFAVTYANGPIAVVVGKENNRFGDSLINVGGNYNFGVAKLFAGYGLVKGGTAAARDNVAFTAVAVGAPGGGTTPVAADGKIKQFSVGATVPFGNAIAKVGFNRYDTGTGTFVGQNLGKGHDDKLGLGVQYNLSKRTYVYTDVASISRKYNAAGTNPASNNDKVTAFDLGIAHAF